MILVECTQDKILNKLSVLSLVNRKVYLFDALKMKKLSEVQIKIIELNGMKRIV